MGKSTISMAISHCYVSSPEGRQQEQCWKPCLPMSLLPAIKDRSRRSKVMLPTQQVVDDLQECCFQWDFSWSLYNGLEWHLIGFNGI